MDFCWRRIACGAVSGAHAADLPFLRGGFTDGYSRAPVVWQGFYVGGQGSWGSQKSAVPGVSDMQATFVTPPGVSPYAFGTPLNTVNSLHGGYGGFFRIQRPVRGYAASVLKGITFTMAFAAQPLRLGWLALPPPR